MSKFVVVKNVDLSFLGEEWNGCFLKVSGLTLGEVEKLSEMGEDNTKAGRYMVSLVSDKFLEGKGFDGGKIVDIKKEDVKDLPLEVVSAIFEKLTADVSKKK